MSENKEGVKGQLEEILRELLIKHTTYDVVNSQNENNTKYPRIEFEVFEVNLNQEIMTTTSEYDEVDRNIIDNYNRISRYLFDFTLIHKVGTEGNIDNLLKTLTNYYKMDRYFHYLDYSEYDIKDITVNQDFKINNLSKFFLDQNMKRDNYTFTLDVELEEKDIIAAGIIFERGDSIE